MRRAGPACAMLATLVLAGCSAPAPDWHEDWHEDWRIILKGDGFQVFVPLWEDGTAERAEALHAVSGDTTAAAHEEDGVAGVLLTGDGRADLEAHLALCCGDGFVDLAWTAAHPDGLPIQVLAGTVTELHVRPAATGPDCWREDAYGAVATMQEGRHVLPGHDASGCP